MIGLNSSGVNIPVSKTIDGQTGGTAQAQASGPCRASPKARRSIMVFHRISLFFFPQLCGLGPYG